MKLQQNLLNPEWSRLRDKTSDMTTMRNTCYTADLGSQQIQQTSSKRSITGCE